MPAANNIENHDNIEKSGLASLPPRRIRPNGESAMHSVNRTKKLPLMMNSASPWIIDQLLLASKTFLVGSGELSVTVIKRRVKIAAKQKTRRCISIPQQRILSCPTTYCVLYASFIGRSLVHLVLIGFGEV